MKPLSVSLVTYLSPIKDLEALLHSFDNIGIEFDFYVIDNSPNDDLKSFFENKPVIYQYLGTNAGYGGGHNVAMRQSIEKGYKYHLVVNPDVFFKPNTLETMFAYMEANPGVGQCGPKIFWPDGTMQYACRRSPRPMDLFARRFLPRNLVKKRLDRYEMRETGYDKVMEVEFLSGSFMFMRVAALKEAGIFDESFFMYMEDVDLTKRIGEKYKTVFLPDAHVFHERATAHRTNYRLLYIFINSLVTYYNKHGWLPLS